MGDLSPGSVFAGHRIEAVAGRGGMGVVYRAVQLSLDRTVALKVIAPALMQDAAIRRRFMRESKVAASIDHPNVIPIYYTGEEGGVAFIAMRYVPGDDLRTLVRRSGALPPERAAWIVGQVAAALDAAHAAGLVHRDVKPANVLLDRDDHVYLTDFGLTKGEISEGATRPGHWVGTLDFVAPEQIRGERIDARADVYGLGCLLYYALSSQPPFARGSDEAKLWAHLSEPPPRPSENGAPQVFDDVIERALAKLPDSRYPSAGDLGRAALAAAAGRVVSERERVVAVGAAAPIEVETRTAMRRETIPLGPPPGQQPNKTAGRRRRSGAFARAGLLAAALLGVGIAGGYAMQRDDEPQGSDLTPTATPIKNGRAEVHSVRVGGRLNGIAYAGGHVWTGEFRRPMLTAVDPDELQQVKGLWAKTGVGLAGLSVRGRSIWAILARDDRLVEIDARTGRTLAGPFSLPDEAAANAVVATKDDVWVAITTPGISGDAVLRIDPKTGAVRERLKVIDSVRRIQVARGALWLLASQPSTLVRIGLEKRKRQRYRLESVSAGDLAIGAGYVWVTLTDANLLERVDPTNGDTAIVSVGGSPAGVAVRDDAVWVANRSSSTVSRVDLKTLRVTHEVEVPINPYEVTLDGEDVWVATLTGGTVTRVRLPD